MSTAHQTDTKIMNGQSDNGPPLLLELRLWAYPAGVESLPDLLAVLEGMSEQLEQLAAEAEELLDKASTAVAFAEERILPNQPRSHTPAQPPTGRRT